MAGRRRGRGRWIVAVCFALAGAAARTAPPVTITDVSTVDALRAALNQGSNDQIPQHIRVAPGHYERTERIRVDHRQQLTVEAVTPGTVVLNASSSSGGGSGGIMDISDRGHLSARFIGLIFTGSTCCYYGIYVLLYPPTSEVTFSNCTISYVGSSVRARPIIPQAHDLV